MSEVTLPPSGLTPAALRTALPSPWRYPERADAVVATLDAWVHQHAIGVARRLGAGVRRQRLTAFAGAVAAACVGAETLNDATLAVVARDAAGGLGLAMHATRPGTGTRRGASCATAADRLRAERLGFAGAGE